MLQIRSELTFAFKDSPIFITVLSKTYLFPTSDMKSFIEAKQRVFPKAEMQSCIILQAMDFLKYVANKDQKAFLADLKSVYRADSKDLATSKLDK